jgi:tRNA (mo5U34)-methyltransferase
MSWSSAAGDPELLRLVRRQSEAIGKNTAYHSLDLGNGEVLPGIIPIDALEKRLGSYPLPQDLRGKRVLDIGAASGWNSFEAERRGAEVVAIDCVEYPELLAVKRLRASRIEYAIIDIDELTPERFGVFDYVIFFGVLYHLRHPLLALERVCSVTRSDAFIESYVVDANPNSPQCSMEFYETDELGGQIDNWFGPTTRCLLALVRSAGFPVVWLSYVSDRRAGLVARRKWESGSITSGAAAPFLCSALNNRHDDAVFQCGKDEYIYISFLAEGDITRENVFVHVDQFGAPALTLSRADNGLWQVNVRVPPGLMPGIHHVRVGLPGTPLSNPREITVLPASADRRLGFESFDETFLSATAPKLIAALNSADSSPVFHGYRNETLGCRFLHPDRTLKLSNVQMLLDDAPYPLLSISMPERGIWQVSARLRSLTAGEHTIRLRVSGSGYSNVHTIVWDPS